MIKLRNVKGYSIDKVHCCYFDDENMPIIDVRDLKITTNRPLKTTLKKTGVTDFSIDKVHSCYFDEGNLPVID